METVNLAIKVIAFPAFWIGAIALFVLALRAEDYKTHLILALIMLSAILGR